MENVKNVKHQLKLYTKYDIILVLSFIFFSLFFLVSSTKNVTKPDIVEVRVSNKIISTTPISKNGIYTVKGALGDAQFEIRDNKVRMLHSSCSNKICINKGWISKINANIICIPNKVTLTLLTSSTSKMTQKNAVDSISK